jgi:hypothetical protein
METKSSVWTGVKKTEKLSIVVISLCIAALVVLILFRPF